jgi:hypothetical protein
MDCLTEPTGVGILGKVHGQIVYGHDVRKNLAGIPLP